MGCLLSSPDDTPSVTATAEAKNNRFRCCIDSCDDTETSCLCCVTIKLSKSDLRTNKDEPTRHSAAYPAPQDQSPQPKQPPS